MMKSKILITGGSGQVGSSLFNLLIDEHEILKPTKDELNFLNPNGISHFLNKICQIS